MTQTTTVTANYPCNPDEKLSQVIKMIEEYSGEVTYFDGHTLSVQWENAARKRYYEMYLNIKDDRPIEEKGALNGDRSFRLMR